MSSHLVNRPQPLPRLGAIYYRVTGAYSSQMILGPFTFQEYEVVSLTPNGFRVKARHSWSFDKKTHIIFINAHKKFAHPSRIEAIWAFYHRKSSHVMHLKHKLGEARSQLVNTMLYLNMPVNPPKFSSFFGEEFEL